MSVTKSRHIPVSTITPTAPRGLETGQKLRNKSRQPRSACGMPVSRQSASPTPGINDTIVTPVQERPHPTKRINGSVPRPENQLQFMKLLPNSYVFIGEDKVKLMWRRNMMTMTYTNNRLFWKISGIIRRSRSQNCDCS